MRRHLYGTSQWYWITTGAAFSILTLAQACSSGSSASVPGGTTCVPGTQSVGKQSFGSQAGGGNESAGGSASWGSGGRQWGGGGRQWSGGASFWTGGGGSQWSVGGKAWANGAGEYSGGTDATGGGGSAWSAGGPSSSVGSWFAATASSVGNAAASSGVQGPSSGPGVQWSGGGSDWAFGKAFWTGGFPNTFPFLGWAPTREGHFRGVPQKGYVPGAFSALSVLQDTSACPAGQVRLGGFAYPVDVEGWQAFIALGFNKALCIPTPGNQGLLMNSTVGNSGVATAGGYALTADLTNTGNDAYAIKSMVGFGEANIATQYGGNLCASIGSLAAAKRSCAVGIANVDTNHVPGGTLSERGATLNLAQSGAFSSNIPFGRHDGYGLYGAVAGDLESYANHAIAKYNGALAHPLPATAAGVSAWNANQDSLVLSDAAGGAHFQHLSLAASGRGGDANAANLLANVDRSVGAVSGTNSLNMSPIDPGQEIPEDMNQSLPLANGDLYALSLHSLAVNQAPLYGSGAGRWFFHGPADSGKPLLDLSSVFQGSMNVVTGVVSGTPLSASLANAYISQLQLRYADWNGEPTTGTQYIDFAGQSPTQVYNDADRQRRLADALGLKRPRKSIAGGRSHACAIVGSGGKVKCWGTNPDGELGNGTYYDTSIHTNALDVLEDAATPLQGVTTLSAGNESTCALLEDGTVQCWGGDWLGDLGNGSTLWTGSYWYDITGYAGPVVGLPSAATNPVVALGSSYWDHCAVLQDGTVWCWGLNEFGELGQATTDSKVNAAIQIPGIANATGVAGGNGHFCALIANGTIQCWGNDDSGQLGNGDPIDPTQTATRLAPTTVLGITNAVQIAAGASNTCAVLQNGAVQCWGQNDVGQLGNGSTAPATAPTTVSGLTGGTPDGSAPIAVALDVKQHHACALTYVPKTMVVTAKCWGFGYYGQLGNGLTQDVATTPQDVVGLSSSPANAPIAVALTELTTCFRLANGAVQCVGQDYQQARPGFNAVPTPVAGVSGAKSISMMHEAPCVVTASGQDLCWGYSGGFRLDPAQVDRYTPTVMPGITNAVQSMGGGAIEHNCVVLADHTLSCWGISSKGEVGVGTVGEYFATATHVPGLPPIAAVTSTQRITCALAVAGDVYCWGWGVQGDLGNGTTDTQGTAGTSKVAFIGGAKATAIAGGTFFACAIMQDGTVQCWGDNRSNQLGNGTTTNSTVPVQVAGLSGVTKIALGDHGDGSDGGSGCAIVTGGALKCWGSNVDGGSTGDGTTSAWVPVTQIPGMTSGVTDVSVGAQFTCAMQAGTVYCWGLNDQGQLGDGTTTNRLKPVPIKLTGAVALASEFASSCALMGDGSVQCWGSNSNGQQGYLSGTLNLVEIPAAVGTTRDNGLLASQGSVLVTKDASDGTVTGHITPIVYSMSNGTTGTQALMATYNPLAAAAAEFIEQYTDHVAACTNTTPADTAMTLADQQSGAKLFACVDPTDKALYLAGMATFLAGAQDYLFGNVHGSLTNIGPGPLHYPWTLVAPHYTETEYHPEYAAQLKAAVAAYDTAIIASSATRLERTLQLVGIDTFTTNNAVITSRVTRSGTYGTQCVVGEGFAAQGVVNALCGDGICSLGVETSAACPADCVKTTTVASCTPETDAAFCGRLGACGPTTAPDACGTTRTVATCGQCAPSPVPVTPALPTTPAAPGADAGAPAAPVVCQ